MASFWFPSKPTPKINNFMGPSPYYKSPSKRSNSSSSLPNKLSSSRNSSSSSIDSSDFETPRDDLIIEIKQRLDNAISNILTCDTWNRKDCKLKIKEYFKQLSIYLKHITENGIPIEDKYNYIKTLEKIQDHIKDKTDSPNFSEFIEKQSIKRPIISKEFKLELKEEDIPEIERELQEKYSHLLEDLKKHNPELAGLTLNEIIKKMSSTTYGGNKKYPLIRSKRFQYPARGKVFSRSNTKKKPRKHRRKTVRRHRG